MNARRAIILAALFLAAWPSLAQAQRYDPSLDFYTIATPHFRIHFHQDERDLAARLAAIAEEVRSTLLNERPLPEPGRTHVILSGQHDVPNGWATTVPFNVIEIRTVWPRASSSIGNSDDWLRLVFTHEYAHILHLDRSKGVFGAARQVFGRVPFAMPNLFLPIWQVEGIATWRESVATGNGRVNDGMARRMLGAASRANTFEPIDRTGGGLVTWPAGDGSYFYGGLFHDYLAARFGPESLERLTSETARWPPFFGRFAFRRVFGASPENVWRDFAESWAATAAPGPRESPASRVTQDGFQSSAPRWDPGQSGVLFYQRRTPHRFPSIVRVDLRSRESRTLVEQFHGESISIRGSRLVFDQLDLAASTSLVGDLYVIDDLQRKGSVRRLTRHLRAGDADLSPDGSRLAFVVTTADRRYLATMGAGESGGAPAALISEPGVYFSRPRWSPDGRRLVVERQRQEQLAEIVFVDVASKAVEAVAPGVGTRQATPAWSPDGEVVVFAAAHGNEPFNLVAVSVSDRRAWRVTSRVDGARAPDVSPDGSQIAFLGYTTEGEDVFVAPFDRTAWTPIENDEGRGAGPDGGQGLPSTPLGTGQPLATPARAEARALQAPIRPYSPLHGFIPRYWAPLVETGDDGVAVGGMTSASDALGRHAYDVSATVWSGTHQADVDVTYSYQRWRPWLFASLSREGQTVTDGLLTSRTLSAGVVLPMVTVRRTQQLVGLIHAERLGLDVREGDAATFVRNAARIGWSLSTSKAFGYSISREQGVDVAVASEHVREAFGADGRADALLAEARFYERVVGEHSVVAVRAAGAVSGGDRAVRQLFTIANAGPAEGPLAFDSDAIALFRGGGSGQIAGTRVAVLNLDYRFPIWRLERGIGAYPAFFRWMHGAAFVDVADAWSSNRSPRPRIAAGLEAAADVVLGHNLPLTLAAGVSWRVDASREDRSPHFYARVGKSF